jgi:Tol biopolymer transport system component
MTAVDRFDPFERRIAAAVDDIATARLPDYLDDIFQVTARSSQRPRWTFLERWLPMDTTLGRGPLVGRLPIRSVALLLLLLALIGGVLAAYVGSQRPTLAPFGPAANGQLVFGLGGDLYVADSLSSEPRLLVGGSADQGGAVLSPDGQLIAYDNVKNGQSYIWVAEADGSNPRQVFDDPFTGNAFAWAPDSRTMAVVTEGGDEPKLWIVNADSSTPMRLAPEGIRPWDAVWDPQRPGVLLIRGEDPATTKVDLYFIDTKGAILSKLGLAGRMLNGPFYEFSGLAMSPDGATIAYNSVEAEEPPFNRFRVHVMNRDGSNDRTIPAPLATRYSQAWPVFSPDGKSIMMESWETGTDGTDKTRISRLALAPADASAPARWLGPTEVGQTLIKVWSPDGTRIILALADKNELYVVDPLTDEFEKLPWSADLPGWQRTLP